MKRGTGEVFTQPLLWPRTLCAPGSEPAVLGSRKERESAGLQEMPSPWHRLRARRWDAGLRLSSCVSPDLPRLSPQGRASLPRQLLPWECGDGPAGDEL